ncbi:MAG: aminoglycoside 6-adenylyltransferase [Bacteroidetes bacterium]|nr:aminoglycoside 6-adenylyltransferase [Bacteroidota bacterium]
MKMLEKIIEWAKTKSSIHAMILTGSLVGKGKKDSLSDYDIAIFGNDFDFINNDKWIDEIGKYLVCIHDQFDFFQSQIPTRLTIFKKGIKVDFSFHPISLLHTLVEQPKLPDSYNIGYKILLDKDCITSKMQKPNYKAYRINKPSGKTFDLNCKEFWFEIYHVAKYISREDLWTAQTRAHATKKWLLQMIEWNHAIDSKWNFSPKQDGKNMKDWIDKKLWSALHDCFGRFDKKDSWRALKKTMKLYRKVAVKTASQLKYIYDHKMDEGISEFVNRRIK